MRVLTIVGAYVPAYVHGGIVQTTHYLSKALIELGLEVFVLTTDRCGEQRLEVPKGDTSWDGVPVRYCHWIKCPIAYFSLELPRQVRRRASQFDIVLMNSSWTAYSVMAALECWRANLPYVIYAHGSYAPARLKRGWLKKKVWWWLLDRHVYNRAATVIALTKAEISHLHLMGIKVPVEHIPNGVDIESLKDGASRAELEQLFPQLHWHRYVLYLGRLEPIKGLDMLIPAFKKAAEGNDHVLVIAGPDEGGYLDKLRRLVQECDLEQRVIFTGMVTGRIKNGLLQNADLFVLSSYGEGMGIATLEALACGTPVLISEECGLPEVEEGSAGFVVPVSIDGVAAGLERALGQPQDVLKNMGQRGQRLVAERFTWPGIALQTADLCQFIVDRNNSGGGRIIHC